MRNTTGDVPKLMQASDWANSSLGAAEHWPVQLKTVVELMLHAKAAMFLVWGEQQILLYNDAYVPVLGVKHPKALGRPMVESWAEVWDEVSTLLRSAFNGIAQEYENHPFTIVRNNQLEQAWFDFSYTPIFLDASQVGGVLCILTEKTTQVLSERALRKQAESLRQLFENAPGFMALLRGPQHVFEQANVAYRKLIGARDPIGKPAREVLPEIEGQGFFELLDDVYRSAKPFVGRRYPVRLHRAPDSDLETRWIDFIYQPEFDKEGHVKGVFVQGSDVTHHVQTEMKLEQIATLAAAERDRLNVLLDTIPTGIIIVDSAGKVLASNTAIKAIWGEHFSPSEGSPGSGAWKVWWADGTDRHGKPVLPHEWPIVRALRGEANSRGIFEMEPVDTPSARRVILLVAAPLRDSEDKVSGALVAQTDITDQIRAEEALRESEAKFKVIANAIPHLVWSNLPDGTHDFFNDRWHEFTGLPGLSREDGWESLVHPDDLVHAAERWAHALVTGDPYEIEYRLRYHATGEYRWFLSKAVPIYGPGGRIVRWLGTATDVHAQRVATDELRHESTKKDEFLAMLAHELRNPLAPIKAAADLLKIARVDPHGQAQAAAIIHRQVRHVTELVDDLLDVSRVTRGLVELDQRTLDVKSVVSGAVEQVRPLIEERGHVLHVHADGDHAAVLGDQTRLVQVVVNLLSNAAKYTPQGGVIDVSVGVQDDEVRISVQDNGSGIEPTLLPYVFDIFTQGIRTPDRAQGGLGLGLALVKSLVVLHGGSVVAHSDGPGKGSLFEVRLPALRETTLDANTELDVVFVGGMATSKRIMIVDDNVDAAQSLAQLLEALGHKLCVRFDARNALASAPVFKPEVFILDIGLPDIDGYELVRSLKAQGTVPALYIALTGYGQAHDRVLSRAAGFDRHFVKPVDIEVLNDALKSADTAGDGAQRT